MLKTLRLGSGGIELALLCRLLNAPLCQTFTPDVESLVIAYQRARGLSPDGVVGPVTWTALIDGPGPAVPAPDPLPAIDVPDFKQYD
ncbi:MAG: peptidoglycan-binding protein, partial [Clostridiales bacterium]|nr:peptidoglycan-binding protein [Clostridiales bacterium]